MPEEVFISYGSADRGGFRISSPGSGRPVSPSGSTRPASRCRHVERRNRRSHQSLQGPHPRHLLQLHQVQKRRPRTRPCQRRGENHPPVFLEPTEIPESMKYQLAGIQRVEYFAGNEEEAIGSVLRALSRLGISTDNNAQDQALGQAPAAPTQAKRNSPPSRSRPSRWPPCSRQSSCSSRATSNQPTSQALQSRRNRLPPSRSQAVGQKPNRPIAIQEYRHTGRERPHRRGHCR